MPLLAASSTGPLTVLCVLQLTAADNLVAFGDDPPEQWIHTWTSGLTDGFLATRHIQNFVNTAISSFRISEVTTDCGIQVKLQAHVVMGMDFVLRSGAWGCEIGRADVPIVAVSRSGSELPEEPMGSACCYAEGDTEEVSSTQIRAALLSGSVEMLIDAGCHPGVAQMMAVRLREETLFRDFNTTSNAMSGVQLVKPTLN